MGNASETDYGPLEDLIGIWRGDSGLDTAPGADGDEMSPYYEEITFSARGGVTNAKVQNLAALHYRQIVTRKSDGQVFHDETGYWMWEASTNTVMHSLTIPRGVCVLAGGTYAGEKSDDGRSVIHVSAKVGDAEWGIIQSPFMSEKAQTNAFDHRVVVGGGKLTYNETMTVKIYGKTFKHTDANELTRN